MEDKVKTLEMLRCLVNIQINVSFSQLDSRLSSRKGKDRNRSLGAIGVYDF